MKIEYLSCIPSFSFRRGFVSMIADTFALLSLLRTVKRPGFVGRDVIQLCAAAQCTTACLSPLLSGRLLSLSLLSNTYYECHRLHSFLSFTGSACAWCFQILPCSPFPTPVPPSCLQSSSSQSRMLNKQTKEVSLASI